jgi:AraC-like DNA-binding protein
MEQPLSVPTLASGVGLSPSRFAHLFASTFGMPAMRYVERVRMEEAKALLSTGTAPVNLIARRVGYESEFYFSRRFKVYTGLSPSLYRAQESGWQ